MSDDFAALKRVLDRPVWHALTGRQAALSVRGRGALRFAPEYGPLAAAADGSEHELVGLAAGGELWLLERERVIVPPGLALLRQAECLQMVATAVAVDAGERRFEELGDGDADEMLALATLTRPGPFATRTHRLGGFVGIRQEGRLVAMAGERLKPGRLAEVSGVCTHPDHRGHGHAGFLMRVVAARILARGEWPFLHCYASNAGAIALYQRLGFVPHRSIMATVLAPG